MIELFFTNKTGTYIVPVVRIEWKGEKYRAPRSITAEIISSGSSLYTPFDVEVGASVVFRWKEKELFRGTVFSVEQSSDGHLSIVAHDMLYYLIQNSDMYTFKGAKASDILRRICADYKLPVGQITDTEYKKPSQINDGDTLMDIVLMALDTTYKQTGARFTVRSRGGKIDLLRNRDEVNKWVIERGVNLLDYTFSSSIEEIATRVKLVSEKDGVKTTIVMDDTDLQRKYGILQLFETVSDDTNKAQLRQRAKQMLADKGKVNRSFSITAIGLPDVISGTGVHVIVPDLGIKQGYYVDQDQHTFEGSSHTMSLTLTLTDELPEIDGDQQIDQDKAAEKEDDDYVKWLRKRIRGE